MYLWQTDAFCVPGSSAAAPDAAPAAGPEQHGVAVSLQPGPLSQAVPGGSGLTGLSAAAGPAEPAAAEVQPAGADGQLR